MNKFKRNFLSLPDIIEASNIPTGSGVPNGIISKIKNEVSSDILSYVEPSAVNYNYIEGDTNTIVNWNNFIQVRGDEAYLQIEFVHGYVYPTSYSIKGINRGVSFSREWELYGFNTENGEKTLLSSNKSEGSTFCCSGTTCNSDAWFDHFRLIKVKLPQWLLIPKVGFPVYLLQVFRFLKS